MIKQIILIITIISFSSMQLNCAEQKVSQETADKLGEELISKINVKPLQDIKKLIDKGANINKRGGGKNDTAFNYLVLYAKHLMIAYDESRELKQLEIIEKLKYLLNQPNLDVNEKGNYGLSDFPLDLFINALKSNKIIPTNDVKAILKLFFERGADLDIKNYAGKNFFDYAKENKLLQEAYDEYLAALKKKNLSALCGQLDKDLPFMSKDLSDLIAGYAVECEYKKKKEDKPA